MAVNTEGQQDSAAAQKSGLTPRRIAWCIFLGAIVIAVALAVVLPDSGARIQLPAGSAAASSAVTEKPNYELTDTDISTENVQQVIASLTRPAAYSASVSNTLYWNGDWKEIHAIQYVRDGVCLTEYRDASGNAERMEAVNGDRYYAWRRDSATYYTGSTGTVSADDTGMIPTYETVIAEEPASITEAGLRTVNGESCIYVTVADANTGYSLTYWVSAVSGLLVQADYTRGSELVRSVVVSDIQQEEPAASLFVLPDSTSLLPAQTQ